MANPPSRTSLDFGLMIRSTLALSLLVLAFWGVSQFFTKNPNAGDREVDYQPIAASAARQSDFDVLAPPSLPEGWRATAARLEPDGRWTLSVLTASDEYLGVDQSKNSLSSVADRLAEGSESAGSAPVGDRVWRVRAGPDERLTYLSRDAGVTTAVTGTTSREVLEDYITSLQAR